MEHDTTTPTWRQLPFYELAKIRDADDFSQTPKVFRSSTNVTAITSVQVTKNLFDEDTKASGSNAADGEVHQRYTYILVGQANGEIAVCEPEHYAVVGSWSAFHGGQGSVAGASSHSGRVTHLAADTNGRIVSLGEDHGARFPILRIWDLEADLASKGGRVSPRLLAEAKIQHGSQPFPVASLALTTSSKFLAIGLGDGTVLLLRNLNEALSAPPRKGEGNSSIVAAVSLPKFKVIHQASTKPGDAGFMDTVTGLGFAEDFQNRAEHRTNGGKDDSRRKGGPAYKPRIRAGTQAEEVGGSDTVTLYIVTLTKTLRYVIIGKAAGSPISMVDDVGCALGCASIVPPIRIAQANPTTNLDSGNSLNGKMIVAREDAIYAIGSEGREMSLAFEGKKSTIQLMDTQLVIVSPPLDATAASISATVRKYVAGKDRESKVNGGHQSAQRSKEVAKITIFDLEGKFVAYSGTIESGVRSVWTDPQGSILVLSDDGILCRLDEKSLRQKLDLLYRKSLFVLAIGVAQSHARRRRAGNVASLLADIHRRYGDALYEKGDFEGSIAQFVKTIGITQPSYVIRKFLDAQRITNLTTYLQELHEKGYANADHTTLLLNCFAKLKDVASLDKFIKRSSVRSTAANGDTTIDDDDAALDASDYEANQDDLPFDLDTAIRVCRQGGYYEHAAYLARRYCQLDEYIRIQVEDMSDCKAAMQHIRGLTLADAERNLVRYGRRLLKEDTEATTDLLIEICSGAFAPTPVASGTGVNAAKMETKTSYLDYINPSKLRKNTLDGDTTVPSALPILEQEEQGTGNVIIPKERPPSPRIFFSHFIAHPVQFIRFLETIALARWGQKVEEVKPSKTNLPNVVTLPDDDEDYTDDEDRQEQKLLWNTLFEIYLTEGAKTKTKEYRERAIALLEQHTSLEYDISTALITCQQEDFAEGTILLYERLGMYEDILRLHIHKERQYDEEDDVAKAIEQGQLLLKALQRYGSQEQGLYAMVLGHFVASQRLLDRHEQDVKSILSRIFEDALLSPLEVVQMLSKKGVATIGLLRDHLMGALDDQQSDIATNASLTRTYREETRTKDAEIEALRDVNQPRIFQQSRCSACAGTLDLPSIHFMCRHSFHSRCLAEAENECPLCAQSHGVILEIRRNNMQFGRRHDLFIDEVKEADDGFDAIANMFSKGLFDERQLTDDRN